MQAVRLGDKGCVVERNTLSVQCTGCLKQNVPQRNYTLGGLQIPFGPSHDTWYTYDKVSAIVEISLPLAAYFDIPQNGAKTYFFKQNH